MGSVYYTGYQTVYGQLNLPSSPATDFRNGYSAGSVRVVAPGEFSGTIRLQLYGISKDMSYAIDLTELTLQTGGSGGSSGGTGYTGLTEDDKSWWSSFWTSQTTMSPATAEAWSDMLDDLKAVGPWGDVAELSNMHSENLNRQMLPDGFVMPKWNQFGVPVAGLTVSGIRTNTPIASGGAELSVDGTWTLSNPWFRTETGSTTVAYWMGGFRTLLRGVLWIGFVIAVVFWIRGKITA
jgi:hypothetical protein